MASTPTYEKGKLYYISIIDFRPDPNQPWKVFDAPTPPPRRVENGEYLK